MNPSTQRARALVDALIAQGITHVVTSPGSRNAPIIYALARAEEAQLLQVHVRIDERVAAFTALGLSKVQPAAVVTTSGTAAANLYPALLEAYHGRVGLIAITADRPHDLRGVGANQTTQQVGMFTPTIPTVDLPTSTTPTAMINHVTRAAATARGVFTDPRPVHLNIAFDDPLTPQQPTPGAYEPVDNPGPRLTYSHSEPPPTWVDVDPPTVVVAGDGAGSQAGEFAQQANLPLLAEPSSGARGATVAIPAYRHVLPDLASQVAQVIVFGRPTLSREVSHLLGHAPQVRVVAADSEWADQSGNAAEILGSPRAEPGPQGWLETWQEAGRKAHAALPESLASRVVRHGLSPGQPPTLLGSSMAIRYADLHAPVGEGLTASPVYASRGLAGIDGTISTASGIALATGPLRAIVGDLTFLHDVGALFLGPGEELPEVDIVVLNDNGGGIFSTVEHGQEMYRATFERFFATPVNLGVEEIARACGYNYVQVTSLEHVPEVLSSTVSGRRIVDVTLRKVSATFQVNDVN